MQLFLFIIIIFIYIYCLLVPLNNIGNRKYIFCTYFLQKEAKVVQNQSKICFKGLGNHYNYLF